MHVSSHENIISSREPVSMKNRPFTVLMPVFNQCAFVRLLLNEDRVDTSKF